MGLIEEIRAIHDDGFALVARRVREVLDLDNSTHRRIAELIQFREAEVGWASLDGEIKSLGTSSFAAWMAVNSAGSSVRQDAEGDV